MGYILDGKQYSLEIQQKLAKWIADECEYAPELLILTAGNNDASKVYVQNKLKIAKQVGINARQLHVTQEMYNDSSFWIKLSERIACVDGVILQLPVPDWCDAGKILSYIPIHKDVDGLTQGQVGKLHLGMEDALLPCTPAGVCSLIQAYVPLSVLCGKNALIIGRSDLVGRPLAELLLQIDMNVTICHSKTPKDVLLEAFAKADLVVAAVGKPNLITESDAIQYEKDHRHEFYNSFETKRGRIIVDVGINRDTNNKLCGDLPEDFKDKYSAYYTPVPGGVGPMTVAMLMLNTYVAATKNS